MMTSSKQDRPDRQQDAGPPDQSGGFRRTLPPGGKELKRQARRQRPIRTPKLPRRLADEAFRDTLADELSRTLRVMQEDGETSLPGFLAALRATIAAAVNGSAPAQRYALQLFLALQREQEAVKAMLIARIAQRRLTWQQALEEAESLGIALDEAGEPVELVLARYQARDKRIMAEIMRHLRAKIRRNGGDPDAPASAAADPGAEPTSADADPQAEDQPAPASPPP